MVVANITPLCNVRLLFKAKAIADSLYSNLSQNSSLRMYYPMLLVIRGGCNVRSLYSCTGRHDSSWMRRSFWLVTCSDLRPDVHPRIDWLWRRIMTLLIEALVTWCRNEAVLTFMHPLIAAFSTYNVLKQRKMVFLYFVRNEVLFPHSALTESVLFLLESRNPLLKYSFW